MDKFQARLLAEKFASGDYTEAEHEDFCAWFSQLPVAESRLLLEEYSGIFEALQGIPAKKELWEKIRYKLDEPRENYQHGEEEGRPVVINFRRRWWMAAAAVLLILLGSAAYFFLLTRSHQPLALSQQQRFKNDAVPGRNAAVLTIAGGQQILLESNGKEVITVQGNTTIVNNKGQLIYNADRPSSGAAVATNTLTTQRGNQYRLILPDGSKVWLNAASSITYPTLFTGKDRRVQVSGEAYFEIAPNAQRPFKVSVGGVEVQVLGTAFNINAYADENDIRTTLVQGSVRVGTALLLPGQQARADQQGAVQVLPAADIEKILAWKKELFVFSSDDIKSVMRQLSRWYNVDVQYQGDLSGRHFSGIISRNNNILQVLKLLEATEKVKFLVDGKKVTVMP